MKKIVSVFLFSFISSLTKPNELRLLYSNSLPASTSQCYESKVRKKLLYSPDFTQQYYCYEYLPFGYAIVNAETEQKIEFSFTSVSPYLNYSDGYLIYGGPMEYAQIHANGILNAPKNVYSNLEYVSIQSSPITTMSSRYDDCIDNYYLIENLKNYVRSDNGEEYNFDGTCGYVAAAMILFYSKYQYNDKFIDEKYIETVDGNLRFTGEFHDLLVDIGADKNIGHSTTAFDIKAVMEEYCKRIGIKADHFAMPLSTPFNIDMCIEDNKPIALFGSFTDPKDRKKVNHAVTCYGMKYEPLGAGQIQRYFIVNFGWSSSKEQDYSRVYLIDNIFSNPVGSMYNMNY